MIDRLLKSAVAVSNRAWGLLLLSVHHIVNTAVVNRNVTFYGSRIYNII